MKVRTDSPYLHERIHRKIAGQDMDECFTIRSDHEREDAAKYREEHSISSATILWPELKALRNRAGH